jgi:putative phosphoribosyl transferase
MTLAKGRDVVLTVHGGEVHGDLTAPPDPPGIAVVTDGAAGRRDPRLTIVARRLQRLGLGTLVVDLLTADEAQADQSTGAFRQDVPLLGHRLLGAALWLREQWSLCDVPVAYLGLDSGAPAALWAAAEEPGWVETVATMGGRPDRSGGHLQAQPRPVLLIAGGLDHEAVEANRSLLADLGPESRLRVLRGAGDPIDGRRPLLRAADLAAGWFLGHMANQRTEARLTV